MKIQHPEKPEILTWISKETWEKLSLKEKDYIVFLYIYSFKKEEIMRKLYLTTDKSIRNFRNNLKKKLNLDLKNLIFN